MATNKHADTFDADCCAIARDILKDCHSITHLSIVWLMHGRPSGKDCGPSDVWRALMRCPDFIRDKETGRFSLVCGM